ncbi:MAG: hypothetical protein ACFFAT_08820 [Promethearchaeota archaeon]
MNVKGSLLKFFVMNVRANKTGVYDSILTEDEKKFVSQRILDVGWYPLEYYKKIFTAIAKVEVNGNAEKVEEWGYEFANKTIGRIYSRTKKKRSLNHAIKSYQSLIKLWFDFGYLTEEIISENEFNLVFDGEQPDFDLHYYIGMGWIRSFFEAYLDTKISTKFLKKSWEGDEKTIINLTWNS